ncbi:MAG: leucyl/phenylalanyl-tRNA--protein transferase [Ignavibacteria bacterium]|nr:leucyl/phenylalanyl-tRNA--protein transferase [Ignavibacteria bacterium]
MFYLFPYIATEEVTPEIVLNAYKLNLFPMGEDEDNIRWYTAIPRAIIPMIEKAFNTPRIIQRLIKQNIFEIRVDYDFGSVIRNCAYRKDTWINKKIIELYTELHKKGYAHSVETYYNNKLAGGLYGLAIKGAFFGESMFHKKDNASKVALVKLYNILARNNYKLFEIQMITPVFEQFGAVEIETNDYLALLNSAMKKECKFIL